MQREQYFLQCADNTLANDECESVNEIDAAISEAEAEYKYNGKLYDARAALAALRKVFREYAALVSPALSFL